MRKNPTYRNGGFLFFGTAVSKTPDTGVIETGILTAVSKTPDTGVIETGILNQDPRSMEYEEQAHNSCKEALHIPSWSEAPPKWPRLSGHRSHGDIQGSGMDDRQE